MAGALPRASAHRKYKLQYTQEVVETGLSKAKTTTAHRLFHLQLSAALVLAALAVQKAHARERVVQEQKTYTREGVGGGLLKSSPHHSYALRDESNTWMCAPDSCTLLKAVPHLRGAVVQRRTSEAKPHSALLFKLHHMLFDGSCTLLNSRHIPKRSRAMRHTASCTTFLFSGFRMYLTHSIPSDGNYALLLTAHPKANSRSAQRYKLHHMPLRLIVSTLYLFQAHPTRSIFNSKKSI